MAQRPRATTHSILLSFNYFLMRTAHLPTQLSLCAAHSKPKPAGVLIIVETKPTAAEIFPNLSSTQDFYRFMGF
jgi:hypothetical protein